MFYGPDAIPNANQQKQPADIYTGLHLSCILTPKWLLNGRDNKTSLHFEPTPWYQYPNCTAENMTYCKP